MLHKTKSLFGKNLSALDGAIGHVKDFYFDDEDWVVRYLVVDTGPWLAERRVLLSPHALGLVTEEAIKVNLTRDQIEKSPPIDTHKPVSRQYEEDYYRYYGWPAYWDGGQLWGMGGFPIAVAASAAIPPRPIEKLHGVDRHLQSVKAVTGYAIEAADGTIGDVSDFLVDFQTWKIRQLLATTGHWFSHKEIPLVTGKVERISYEESTVFVGLTKATILAAEEYQNPAERVQK